MERQQVDLLVRCVEPRSSCYTVVLVTTLLRVDSARVWSSLRKWPPISCDPSTALFPQVTMLAQCMTRLRSRHCLVFLSSLLSRVLPEMPRIPGGGLVWGPWEHDLGSALCVRHSLHFWFPEIALVHHLSSQLGDFISYRITTMKQRQQTGNN